MFNLHDFIKGSNPGIKQDMPVLGGKSVPVPRGPSPVPCGLASLYSKEFFTVVVVKGSCSANVEIVVIVVVTLCYNRRICVGRIFREQ